MTRQNPLASKQIEAFPQPRLFGCVARVGDGISAPSFFFAMTAQIGNIDPKMHMPFVPTLPAPVMPISSLKRYYSGLMVAVGEVSQECRSVWQ